MTIEVRKCSIRLERNVKVGKLLFKFERSTELWFPNFNETFQLWKTFRISEETFKLHSFFSNLNGNFHISQFSNYPFQFPTILSIFFRKTNRKSSFLIYKRFCKPRSSKYQRPITGYRSHW